MKTFQALIDLVRGPSKPLDSFYLPIAPPVKFPPRPAYRLPDEIIRSIVASGFEAMFPFKFGDLSGEIRTKEEFNGAVERMQADRDFVIKRPAKIAVGLEEIEDIEVQYRFSQHLLSRNAVALFQVPRSIASQYNFLVDLVVQISMREDLLQCEIGEVGAYLFRLRNVEPYRENAFFTDATILVHHAGNIIDIIYGERDSDIDNDYEYGWLADFVRDMLRGSILVPSRFE